MLRKILVVSAGMVLVGLLIAACATPTPPAPQIVKETVVVTKIVEPTKAPAPAAVAATLDLTATEKSPVVPFLADWQKAGHSDITAEAFKHWPTGEVPWTAPSAIPLKGIATSSAPTAAKSASSMRL